MLESNCFWFGVGLKMLYFKMLEFSLSLSLSFVHAHFFFEKIVHAHLKKVLSLTRDFELILDDFG